MKRPKLSDIPIQEDDLGAVLDMSIESIKLGRPAKFDDTDQGFSDFREASISYLEYVRKTNNNPGNEHHLIPDVESWATYLGTTRMTILTYEKSRSDEWQDFIAQMKGAITACKKQLAFRQKIPTVLALFDLTNNSGYVNSSEFKLQPGEQEVYRRVLTAAELPRLGEPKTVEELMEHIKSRYGVTDEDVEELPKVPD